MKYKLLGKSGLRVSELCLGTMTFGEDWGWGASHEESQSVYNHFIESGGNFIDTANLYTNGTSEKFMGEFIKSNRDYIVLATKYSLNMTHPIDPANHNQIGDVNGGGNHRKNMIQSVEASLKRLNTDYIDLYWLHAWDFLTPAEEVLRGLDDLVRSGKILYIGISDTPAWVVAKLNTIAELRGWNAFTALQIKYSLISRDAERDLLPMANDFDLAVTPWGILGSGVLTGKFNKGVTEPTRIKADNIPEQHLKIAGEVIKIADEIGVRPSQVATNWLRQQKALIIPIIGARNTVQLKENLACLNFELSEEHITRLNEVSKIDLGFPHDFLSGNKYLFAGTDKLIHNHRNQYE